MRTVHWTAAVCFSLAMHLGLAGLYLSDEKTAPDMPLSGGNDGIEIGLDTSNQPVDGPAPGEQQTEAPETVEKHPEPVEQQAPPPPKPEPAQAPPPPVDVTPPSAPVPEAELETVAAPAESENLVAVADPQATAPMTPPSSITDQNPAPTASTDKRTSSRNTAGSGSKTGKAGNPGAARDYLSNLMGWLRQHKQYPAELKKKKQQGVVEVKFSIDRSGELLSSSIHKTSGHPQLDAAALQMVADASPMPDIPDALDRETLTLVIPVEYSLITN